MKRFIQVGTGGFGEYWCSTVLPRVASFARPVAAVDINAQALQNARRFLDLPEERCYLDLQKALHEVEADFVNIVVPPQMHESVIDIAIAHGLDVVCEKPLGGNMAACVRIYNKVKSSGRKLAVTMSHRLEVEKQTVQSMVESGKYGKLQYIVSRLALRRGDTSRQEPLTAEKLVASLINNGLIHNLDTMRGVSGSNAKTVYVNGWASALAGYANAASALVILEMENGVRAMLEASHANASALDGWSDEYLRAECALGTIVADHRKVTVRSDLGYPYPETAAIPLRQASYWDHALVIHDFVRWLDGGEPPTTNLDENLYCCALTYAAVESALTGTIVDVRQFLERHLSAHE